MDRFDKLLIVASGELTDYKIAEKCIQKVTPWKKIFLYIVIFLLLDSIPLDFINGNIFEVLNLVRNLFAVYFMVKATSICKSENNYFKYAFLASVICFEILAVLNIVNILKPKILLVTLLIEGVNIIYITFVMLALLNGFNCLVEQSDIPVRIKEQFQMIVFMEMLFVQVLIGIKITIDGRINWKTYICIVFFISAIKAITQILYINEVRNNMVYFGYNITISPLNSRNLLYTIIILQIMLVGLCASINRGNVNKKTVLQQNKKYVIDEVLDKKEENSIRQKLVELGMEENIAADLLEDELINYIDVKKLSHTSSNKYMETAGAEVELHCYIAEISCDKTFTKARILYYVKWNGEIQKDSKESYIFSKVQKESYYFEEINSKNFVGISNDGNTKDYVQGDIINESGMTSFGQYKYAYKINRYFEKTENDYRSYLGQDYYFINNEKNSFDIEYGFIAGKSNVYEWIQKQIEYGG